MELKSDASIRCAGPHSYSVQVAFQPESVIEMFSTFKQTIAFCFTQDDSMTRDTNKENHRVVTFRETRVDVSPANWICPSGAEANQNGYLKATYDFTTSIKFEPIASNSFGEGAHMSAWDFNHLDVVDSFTGNRVSSANFADTTFVDDQALQKNDPSKTIKLDKQNYKKNMSK